MPQFAFEGQRTTFGSQFSSTMWDLGMKVFSCQPLAGPFLIFLSQGFLYPTLD